MNKQILYLIAEAFRGWKQHHLVILPSLITIFLCSVLMGGALFFLEAATELQSNEERLFEIEAFFKSDIYDQRAENLHLIQSWKEIQGARLIDEKEAIKDFQQRFGPEMLELVKENPLPASIRFRLSANYRNSWELQNVQNRLLGLGVFQEVRADKDLVDWLERNQFDIKFWPWLIIFALAFTLWMIIANAVRLTLYSRRLLVENMKYAGGSSFFIQFPFILEGALQGFIGGLFAAIFWYGCLWYLGSHLDIKILHSESQSLILVCMVLGVTLIGAFTSFRSVRQFLARDSWR